MRDSQRLPGGRKGPDREQRQVNAAGGGAAVGGDNKGIISTGPYARNTIYQLWVSGESAQYRAVAELEAREIPVLGTFGEREPVGRAQIIGQVAAEVADGMSVQLYGPPGTGKKAIARAVIRRLSAGPAPVRGIEIPPQGSQPHTLDSVYEFLTGAFFKGATFEPAEQQLRAAAAAAQLAAVVVIDDCDLPAEDLTRLLGTFQNCTFLLTSARQTLYRAGAAHEVAPLGPGAAAELIAQETGHDPAGLQQLQVTEAIRMAGGQAQRLLQYAAFLKYTRSRPGQDPLSLVFPPEQAKLLASGLSEPARRVLVALRTFGTELAPGLFAAVTGLPTQPPAGPGLADAGPELLAAALVTPASTAHPGPAPGKRDIAYRITPDAGAAVDALGWSPASALTAAHGLLPLLTNPDPGTPAPSPPLLLAIATKLHDAGQDLDASQFIRAAMPATVRAGQIQAWIRLVILGVQAATAAGAEHDLAYFLQEDSTRLRLQGAKIAIAAAIAAELAETHHGLPAGSQPARQPGSVLRRAARYHAKATSGSHTTAVATTGAGLAVAVAVAATVILARPAGHTTQAPAPAPARATTPAPAQWTGTQLAAALLPISDFPPGYHVSDSYDDGSLLSPLPAGADVPPTTANCRLGTMPDIVSQEGTFYPEASTAYAGDTYELNQASRIGYLFLGQAIFQFSSPAEAEAYFAAMRTCLIDNKPWSNGVDTAPVNGDQAVTADLTSTIGSDIGSWATEPLFVLHGTDVFGLSAASLPSVGPLTIPGAAELIAKLVARVEAIGPTPSGSPLSIATRHLRDRTTGSGSPRPAGQPSSAEYRTAATWAHKDQRTEAESDAAAIASRDHLHGIRATRLELDGRVPEAGPRNAGCATFLILNDSGYRVPAPAAETLWGENHETRTYEEDPARAGAGHRAAGGHGGRIAGHRLKAGPATCPVQPGSETTSCLE